MSPAYNDIVEQSFGLLNWSIDTLIPVYYSLFIVLCLMLCSVRSEFNFESKYPIIMSNFSYA